jgi:Ca2+-binding RTX toxin-like protein
LGANLEKLTLTGTSALTGTGNELANVLVGNDAGNTLLGLDGTDSLFGGKGNDKLWGGAGDDSLRGGTGADLLIGGAGSDTMSGGLGNDAFVYNNRSEGGDIILDFSNQSGNNDIFHISAAGFGGGLVAGSILARSQFQVRSDNLAQDSDDRFIFRTTDRTLWFDEDGKGGAAAVMIADLQAGATLTHADILLV